MKKSIVMLLAGSCLASISWQIQAAQANLDPYEGFNRSMYHFNQKLDDCVLRPVAEFYKKVLPNFALKGIGNFFNNLNQVPIIANDILQFNFYQATANTWRLFFNSTAGILGFIDVASDIGLPKQSNDFGLTLAKWGYTQSNYLVLPVLGPSTVRDTIGLPVDYNYLSVYPYVQPTHERYELLALNFINQRARLLDLENVMNEAALDKYVFQRNAYLQRRAYLVQHNAGKTKSQDDADF